MSIAVLLALVSIAGLPVGLRYTARFLPQLGPTSAVHALRAYNVRVTVLAELALLSIAVVVKSVWQVPLALTALQLFLFNLLFLLALHPLYREPKPHYTKETRLNVLAFGLLAGLLAYANYRFYFARQDLSARYISTNNPMYFKATAVALLTLFFCQSLNLLLARASHHERFFTQHLHTNQPLLKALGLFFAAIVVLVYLHPFSRVLKLGGLSIADWAWTIVFACVYLGLRLIQRHTRKHSRHAVVKLHKKVNQLV